MITTNIDIKNDKGLSNSITTTKYTILTWLPKSLWEQFRRIANVYFLVISVLMVIYFFLSLNVLIYCLVAQLIGTYAPTIFATPLEPFSTVMTLIFVLMVTSVKEGMEDLERAR